MKRSTICVIGLGSMGRRRIGILKRVCPDARIVGVDERADRRKSLETDLGLCGFRTFSEAVASVSPEILFVCSSPLSHGSLVLEGIEKGCHTFSELNLRSEGYDTVKSLAVRKGKVAFLSSTQLYRTEIEVLCKKVAEMDGGMFYSYHVGQYLPDWHPWEKVEDFFVIDERTNGCREILAIELPWITRCFGRVVRLEVIRKKISGLPLRYDDTYLCLFEHESGTVGSVTVDLVSRKAVRQLEVTGEGGTLSWGGTPDSLHFFSPGDGMERALLSSESFRQDPRYSRTIVEDAYEKEVRVFLDAVRGNPGGILYGYDDDARILNLIDRIEGAE